MHHPPRRQLMLWLVLLILAAMIVPPAPAVAHPTPESLSSPERIQPPSPPEPVLRPVRPPRLNPQLPQEHPRAEGSGQSQEPNSHPVKGSKNPASLVFVPNAGQTHDAVQFYTNNLGGNIFFTPGEIVFSLPTPLQISASKATDANPSGPNSFPRATVKLRYAQANSTPTIKGTDRTQAIVNYLIGSDRRHWRTNLPTYNGIIYQQLYPGIDLHYAGSDGQFKSTYTVSVGADPTLIRWTYEGATDVRVDKKGQLIVTVDTGSSHAGVTTTLSETAPVAWQDIGGKRIPVSARYTVGADRTIRFTLGSYDHTHPLTIDPSISYFTPVDGNSVEYANAIAVDTTGNTYITGSTSSTIFPGAPAGSAKGGSDVIVSKFNASGTLQFTTYLGGTSPDEGRGIAVTSDSLYVVGETYSTDFSNLTSANGSVDGFVVKLTGSGGFQAGRYLGGSDVDRANAVAVHRANNSDTIYVTGETSSANFAANGHDTTLGGTSDAFITKLSSNLALTYTSYLGGSGDDKGAGVAVDRLGRPHVAGTTSSTDFVSQGISGGKDAFFAVLDSASASPITTGALGGSEDEEGMAIAVDHADAIYLTGSTFSSNYKTTTGAYDQTFGEGNCGNTPCRDAFVAKFNRGGRLAYSTFLGDEDTDIGLGIAVDASGDAYVTGLTDSKDFPTTSNAPDQDLNGTRDAFVTRLNSTGNGLFYSTYVGEGSADRGTSIAVQTGSSTTHAYVAGDTLQTATVGRIFTTKITDQRVPELPPDQLGPCECNAAGQQSTQTPQIPSIGPVPFPDLSPQPARGGPVNTRTGNLWTTVTDLVVSSPGPSLEWTRSYVSQTTDGAGALGYGWHHRYATRLITETMPEGEKGTVIVISPHGNMWRFRDTGANQFEPFPGIYSTLSRIGTSYIQTFSSQERVYFNATGQATAMEDAQGRQLSLTYDPTHGRLVKIADAAQPQQRFLELRYDQLGLPFITSVRDAQGRVVNYEYAASSDLWRVFDVMNRETSYLYQNHLLTGIDNALGQPVERTAYDVYLPEGKAISQTLQDGRHFEFQYLGATTTITTTGTNGQQDVEEISYNPNNTATAIKYNQRALQTMTFDEHFAPAVIADDKQQTTNANYNASGQPETVTDALNATTAFAYDTQGRLITETDVLLRKSVRVYDSYNNVVRHTEGITTEFPLGFTTVFTYTSDHWLQELQSHDGVRTRYAYNPLVPGQIITKTINYQDGQFQPERPDEDMVTSYGYDSFGRVITTTVGVGTSLERRDVTVYNADDSVKEVVENYQNGDPQDSPADEDRKTSYGYDALGRRVWVKHPDGRYDVTHYDARGRIDWSVANSVNSTGAPSIPTSLPAYSPARPDSNVAKMYGYDGLGRTALITETGILTGTFNTTTRTFSGTDTRVTRIEYDALSRPITTTLNYRPDLPTGTLPDVNLQTVSEYVPNQNIIKQWDTLGRLTVTEYDKLNRPIKTIRNYENGDPLTVKPENRSWTDGSDTDLITVTRYRRDGQIDQSIDNYINGAYTGDNAADRVTQYAYDALSREIGSTASYTSTVTTGRTDLNRHTTTAYDALTGRIIGQQDALLRWVHLQYDKLGRVTKTVQNCRNATDVAVPQGCAPFVAGDLSKSDRNVPTITAYDALGRTTAITDTLGHVTLTTYDGLGRVQSTIKNYVAGAPATNDTNVTTQTVYDVMGRTIAVTDALSGTTRLAYDQLGHTAVVTDTMGRVTRSGYDGSGTQRWTERAVGTAQQRLSVFQVDRLGRAVATIENYQNGAVEQNEATDRDRITRTVYDLAGRPVQTIDAAGVITAFGYDLEDRLIWVQQNVQEMCATTVTDCNVVMRYAYDRMGNRIEVNSKTPSVQRFTYDAADRMLTSTDPLTQTTSWEYDKLGRMLVQHDPRGTAYDVHYTSDGLDRVTNITSADTSVTSSTTYDGLGRRRSLTDPTGTTNFTYDNLGRLTQVAAPNTGTVGYGYNALGQRTQLSYPSGPTIDYSYWGDGQLKDVRQGTSILANYSYDPTGRLQQVTQANNAVTKYAYDLLDRLVDQRTLVGTTQTSDYSYQYDRLGLRTQATETIASGSFGAAPRMPQSLLTTSMAQSTSQAAATAQIAGATSSQTTGNAPNSTPDLGQMPLAFVPNVGQTDQSVRFQVHNADGGMMFFTPGEVVLSLPTPDVDADTSESKNAAAQDRRGRGAATVRLHFDGAAKTPTIVSESQGRGVVNYLAGNNKANWHTNVPTYASIVYQQLYPGIDLRYSGENGQLKSTYTLAAGADPARIRWRYHGGEDAYVDEAGRLVIAVRSQGRKQRGAQPVFTFAESAPIAWQERDGQRIAVSVRYTINQDGSMSFVLGDYDRSLPLTIDPTLIYSSNLGGGGNDGGKGIAVDSAGNSYIVGSTGSLVFPTANGSQATHGGGAFDAFVSKLSADGQNLLYSTYLGGSGRDEGADIALDSAGNVYVTGKTTSANFPTVNPLQAALAGQDDTFVTKLSANGQTLLYSTYLGGNNADTAGGIAVDTSGNVYVTGQTNSTTFPTVSPFQSTYAGSGDVFVSKLSANGQSLIYSTYVGGSGEDSGTAVAVNNAGQAYITGFVDGRSTTVFPTTAGSFQPTCSSSTCSASIAFVTKLSATGNGLVYSTYLGGSLSGEGQGIAVDTTGNAYVTGGTQATNFPTTAAAPQTVNKSSYDAFLTKLNATGSGLVYSTYFGGNGYDYAEDVAVDSAGNASLVGYTTSTSNFPLVSPRKTVLGGSRDAFVARVNSAGSALVYSTYLGGSDSDEGRAIAVDSSGHAYVTGSTFSTADFPTVNAYQSNSSGDIDGFVTKLNASDSVLLYSTYLGGTGDNAGRSIAVDSAGYAYVTGFTRSGGFPVANAQQQTPGGGYDAFVTKVSNSSAGLIYSTYLGGSGNDDGRGITVDAAGHVYVTGNTTSRDFPTVSPFQAQHQGSFDDVFVAKLNASGNALTYSSYLGGSGEDIGYAIAVDSAGSIIVTGSTDSSNFPTHNANQSTLRGRDAFVTKLNPAGSALLYSTYFGGNGEEHSRSLALAANGKIAITGATSSSDLPIAQGYQTAYGGGTADSFVAQIDPSLTGAPSLGYSSYLGGSGLDIGYGITVDPAGVLYLTGSASSPNFPIKDGLQTTLNGSADAYVLKLNPSVANHASLVYSTYLGGSGVDYGFGIALNQQGQIHVTGTTSSTNFPTAMPLYGTLKGGMDAFVTVYHPTGDSLITSTYLGSSRDDYGYGISVDSQGNIYVTGSTAWSDFPKANASSTIYVYPNTYAFVAKISSPVRVVTYTYDALQRLTGATEQPGFAYSYAYDKRGNRTAASVNGSLWQSRSYNAANQVVGWTYDAAGNLLNDGSQSWTYDALGRLRSNTSTSTTSYTYNGDGTLVSQTSSGTTTRYTQDLAAPLAQVLQTTQGTNPRTSYLYGAQRLGSLTGTIRTWYGSDALGSVRQSLTDSGTIAATLHYDPWGMPSQQSSPVPFGFTGELQTARSGLVHLRARWYQAGQGTFLSRDPFAGFPNQPYSLHPYQYGYSNPIQITDPSGKTACDWCPDEHSLEKAADCANGGLRQWGHNNYGSAVEELAPSPYDSETNRLCRQIANGVTLAQGIYEMGAGVRNVVTGAAACGVFGAPTVGLSCGAGGVVAGVGVVEAGHGLVLTKTALEQFALCSSMGSAGGAGGAKPSAKDLRNQPGIATGGTQLPKVKGKWPKGTQGNAGRIPGQIADKLRGRSFKDFTEFRQEFWKAVAADPDLSQNYKPDVLKRMAEGQAPFAIKEQKYGGNAGGRYILHHVQPIQHGGGVYDLDNLIVVTPRYHQEVLDPSYHFGR